jgi:hypothetical protein
LQQKGIAMDIITAHTITVTIAIAKNDEKKLPKLPSF